MDLFDIRKDYRKGHLGKSDLLETPLPQIELWLQDALKADCLEHSAVVLSTADATGTPSSRVVLLKKIDASGLYIFTNYKSRKGQQLGVNKKAALLFFWPELERQINIEGTVEKCSEHLSDTYFDLRPIYSRLSAYASKQSQEIENRATMHTAWQHAKEKMDIEHLSRPKSWGGYVLQPSRVEFWQGGANRFHDRILFTYENETWHKKRLMP